MILHIPHSSVMIPGEVRRKLLLADDELEHELLRMTDLWTDELFSGGARESDTVIVYPVSRLVVDPERFEHDDLMDVKGMGAVYIKTSDGTKLRDKLSYEERAALIDEFYRDHHYKLEMAVGRELLKTGCALIIDCHSFPTMPLPFEDSAMRRPEICVGIDYYHTPPRLGAECIRLFEQKGYDVAPNTPFKGSLVPSRWYDTEPLVRSIMIEVRRDLYMDENTGERLPRFDILKDELVGILDELREVG